MIPSLFDNEQELLHSIIRLHSPDGIVLDPMFNTGAFYKEIAIPEFIFDIDPQGDCPYGDARSLPIAEDSISCMILDPPFMFGMHGKAEEYWASQKYGIMKDFNELQQLYINIMKEANRILHTGGILFFKCQDYTDSRTTMTHCHVWQWAQRIGFYPKDLAILHLGNRIWNSNLNQLHMRKTHSYFWVFENSFRRVLKRNMTFVI